MYTSMYQNLNGITPSNGSVKPEYNEATNLGKETSSTDKSENEKMSKAHNNDPFSVRMWYQIELRNWILATFKL